jgi:acyl carrier protein
MGGDRDIETRVIEVIGRQLQAEASRVGLEMGLVTELGADSLALLKLTLALEETFDVEISDEDAQSIRTVGDAVASIQKRLQAKHQSVQDSQH